MYTFKSPHELNKLSPDDPAHPVIKELIEDLISAYTWEGITLRDGFFLAIYLANNEYGLSFVIPDEEWVDGELREMIGYFNDLYDPSPAREKRPFLSYLLMWSHSWFHKSLKRIVSCSFVIQNYTE